MSKSLTEYLRELADWIHHEAFHKLPDELEEKADEVRELAQTLEAGVVVVPVSKLDGALHDLAFEVMTRCVKGRTTILVDRVDQAIAKCKAHLQQNGGEGR